MDDTTKPPRLHQRQLFTRFDFELSGEGVLVNEQELARTRTYLVPFENIAAQPVEVTVWSKPALWFAFVFVALGTLFGILWAAGVGVPANASVFWGVLGLVALVALAGSRRSYQVFQAAQPPLVLMKAQPSEQSVNAFVRTVQRYKRRYFARKFLLGTKEGAAADAIHKLAWLRNQGALDDLEFEELKAEAIAKSRGPGLPPVLPN